MRRILALACAAALLQACGGGGGGSTSPAVRQPGTSVAGPSQAGTLALTFAPQSSATASAARRSPRFVSPDAATAAISINGGSATSYNVGPTSALCTTASNTRTCTIPLTAPIGQDTIGVMLLSGGATAALLGSGSNSVTVTGGTAFSVTVGISAISST